MTIFGIDADPEAGFDTAIDPLPVVHQVTDSEPHIPRKHKIDFAPQSLPDVAQDGHPVLRPRVRRTSTPRSWPLSTIRCSCTSRDSFPCSESSRL